MSHKTRKKGQHSDFVKAATRALKEAAKEARRQAKMHGTKVAVMIDGKVVEVDP